MRRLMLIGAVFALMTPPAMAQRGGPPPGRGPGGGAGMRERGMTEAEHGLIQRLLQGHATIRREVMEIPGGVRTITTTTVPELVPVIRMHVRQMKRRVEANAPVRLWDPVFRDIFANASKITLTFRDVKDGIEVTETSQDPMTVVAIVAHARKLNDFVARGHEAAMPPWAGGRGRGRGRGPSPNR